MTDISNGVKEKPVGDFNALSFERKVVELVEELRLKRSLEVEGEKTLISAMDEKYQQELSWDEQIRRHGRQREHLDQQIELLKRKLEDKVCVTDEDKAKQQVMIKAYSQEIRILKEELKITKSEKLNLQKKIQELEGNLKLHDNFQESILNQVSEVRKIMKTLHEENMELITKQKNVMENVASAKLLVKKYDLCNQHLQQCIEIIGKKSECLKRELIKSRSEITLLKQSVPTKKENNSYVLEIEMLRNKVLNLENLLLSSRKENEKTLNNFLESNKLLCKFMDKFSDIQEQEKELNKQLELLREKLWESQNELQKTKNEIQDIEERATLKEKERIESQRSAEMQTESISNQCCSCAEMLVQPSDDKVTAALTSFIPKPMDNNFMDEFRSGLVDLQQNAVMMQSEMSINNGIHSFSVDQLCVNSADKKITLSQVLKRKLEIMESGDQFELISMKKRFMENAAQSMIVVDNGMEGDVANKMLTSYKPNDLPLYHNFYPDISGNPPQNIKNKMSIPHVVSDHLLSNNLNSDNLVSASLDVKNKVLIPREICDQPLCDTSNRAIIASPPLNVKNMSISCKANVQPLCKNLNTDLSVSPPPSGQSKMISHQSKNQLLYGNLNSDILATLPSGVKNEMLISHVISDKPFDIISNLDVSMNPPSVDILLDQKYLTYTQSYENDDNLAGGK